MSSTQDDVKTATSEIVSSDPYYESPDCLAVILGMDTTCPMVAKAAKEQAEAVSSALGELTRKQRLVVELYFGFHDREHSTREIASLMGITHQAVKGLKARALKRLGGCQLAPVSVGVCMCRYE